MKNGVGDERIKRYILDKKCEIIFKKFIKEDIIKVLLI
jgi:hypothetical protein